MHPFLYFRCLHTSTSAEGFHCPHCDGSGAVMAANFYSPIPESGDADTVYYVTIEDASTQVSEEDLPLLEPTREASTQTSDGDLPFDGNHSFENCLEKDCPSQNQTSHEFDHYTNANLYGTTHSNTNDGEFPNQSYDLCNATTVLKYKEDKPSTSEQTCVTERSLLGENGRRLDYQFLTRRGPKKPIEGCIKSSSFLYSYEKEGQVKDCIPPPFSSYASEDASVNKCFRANIVTANRMAQQNTKTFKKAKIIRCKNCKRYFRKESTFIAHKEDYCGNKRKPYKCGECDEIFRDISALLLHRNVHTGQKPFKCTQCNYASAWPQMLKKHLVKHQQPYLHFLFLQKQSIRQ